MTDRRLILFTLLAMAMNKCTHSKLRLGLSSLNEHLFKYNLSLSKFCEHCYGNHTETTEHYLLHCNRNTVSRTTLLLGIKHILCSELNIILQRDLCPTHLTIYLSILNTNFLNAFFSTLNLQKYFQANPPCIILFFFVTSQLNQYPISQTFVNFVL